MRTVSWLEFAAEDAALAAQAEERLARAPSYVATVRADGWPRVHPVGPLTVRDGHLVVPMHPSSPKGHDLRRTGNYALHCGVEDSQGGGGEVLVTGTAVEIEPTKDDRAGGYVVFEMLIGEVLATHYDEFGLNPTRVRWRASEAS